MAKPQRIARPRTRDQIEELAWKTRNSMGLRPFDRVPVASLLEHVLPELIEGFELRVAEPGALGAAEAVTDCALPIITFDQRTYGGLCRDFHRPRMTAMHELGHLLMHTGQTRHAFLTKADPKVDLERQADVFAAAFMMPECAFRKIRSIREAETRFGVSRDAACYRARSLKMPWLISGKPAPSRPRKKGYDRSRTP